MATFDTTRLDGAQYTIGLATHAIRLQNTVEEFMHLVRTEAAYIASNSHLIVQFCRLIDNDKTFPLAAMVVPELRVPQSHDTTENTIINNILRSPGVKRRRPPAPIDDPTNAPERQLIERQTRAMMHYLEYDKGREDNATQEEREETEDIVRRALDIILPEQSNN